MAYGTDEVILRECFIMDEDWQPIEEDKKEKALMDAILEADRITQANIAQMLSEIFNEAEAA